MLGIELVFKKQCLHVMDTVGFLHTRGLSELYVVVLNTTAFLEFYAVVLNTTGL